MNGTIYRRGRVVGRPAGVLVLAGWLLAASAMASDAPPPPDSPMNRLVRSLAAARGKALASPPAAPDKAALLRPEFRFRRGKDWLLLPDLARQLSTSEVERAAVLDLLVQGTVATADLLAAQDLDNDVAVSAAFLMSQLWGVARDREVSEPATDALHAQIVATLAGPEMARVGDADKQRYWEYCLGFPIFVLGMREVATEPEAQADLRTIAAAGFEAVVGMRPDQVDITEQGLVAAAGRAPPAPLTPPARPTTTALAPTPTPTPTARVEGLLYDPPAGWSREDASWATIFRSTLLDVTDAGQPDPNSERRHQAALFILPPRPAPKGGGALFEEVWRHEFDTFDLGDSFVHYRSRLKSGLVIHYMGRWFTRREQPQSDRVYGVLYLVDLGDRVVPITATLVPGRSQFSMSTFNENNGFKALSFPLEAFLATVRPSRGAAPYPAGGLFTPADILGAWSQSSSAFGGMYVYAATGGTAGAAVASSSNRLALGKDGTFQYHFAGYVNQPGSGSSLSTDDNQGTYRLDGDVVRMTPRQPRTYRYDRCAVGIGRLVTPAGPRRVLVMVGGNLQGQFLAPPLLPLGDSYPGVMHWYVEDSPSGR